MLRAVYWLSLLICLCSIATMWRPCWHIRQILQWLSLRQIAIKREPTHYSYRHPISLNMISAKALSNVIANEQEKLAQELEIVNLTSLELDLDLPEDLQIIREMEKGIKI